MAPESGRRSYDGSYRCRWEGVVLLFFDGELCQRYIPEHVTSQSRKTGPHFLVRIGENGISEHPLTSLQYIACPVVTC
jgi:hypothetical protein